MNKKKPLFIYDCDGTMCAPIVFAYALYKQNKNFKLSLSEFKEKHPKSSVATIPGITDLVQYTSRIGHNILLSGGDPSSHMDAELKSTFKHFKDWEYEGQKVPFGQEPEHVDKTDPKIAENLLKNFDPSRVIVLGDSEEEFQLAQNFSKFVPTTLIFRGVPGEKFNALSNINKHYVKDGLEMLKILKKSPKRHKGPSILTNYRIQNKVKVVKVLKEIPIKPSKTK